MDVGELPLKLAIGSLVWTGRAYENCRPHEGRKLKGLLNWYRNVLEKGLGG